ncbi:hypothetical protein ACWGS9_09295 [Bradyrhizobium sp. Arg314]
MMVALKVSGADDFRMTREQNSDQPTSLPAGGQVAGVDAVHGRRAENEQQAEPDRLAIVENLKTEYAANPIELSSQSDPAPGAVWDLPDAAAWDSAVWGV